MKEKEMKYKKAGIIISIVGCVFVVGILLGANVTEPVEKKIEKDYEEEQSWQKVQIWRPLGAENSTLVGSGFLEIFWINISTQDAGGYWSNTSSTHETWSDANMPGASPNAWASADNFDIQSFQSEKTFVIMVRARFNKTHAWETDHFNQADCDVHITVTCTSWAVGSNINNVTAEHSNETRNSTGEDYIWINYIWDNGGTGYQIADDAVMTTSEVYIEARF